MTVDYVSGDGPDQFVVQYESKDDLWQLTKDLETFFTSENAQNLPKDDVKSGEVCVVKLAEEDCAWGRAVISEVKDEKCQVFVKKEYFI